jgi:hypothetical protein
MKHSQLKLWIHKHVKLKKKSIGKVKIHLNNNTTDGTSTISNVIHILGILADFLPVRRMVEGKTNCSFFRDL